MKHKRFFAGILAILMLVSLTGCGSATIDQAFDKNFAAAPEAEMFYAAADSGVMMDAVMEAPAEASGYSYNKSSTTASSVPQNDLSSRKIIKNASLSFETKEYTAFMTELDARIAAIGGYIESSEVYGGGIYDTGYNHSAHIRARIPESAYNGFMNDIGSLGTLTYKSESASDVTMSYVDTESRLKALRTEYDALIAILEKATDLNDVISLQSRITEVTYQIESHAAQLRKYDDLIAYCTINIDVSEVYRETKNVEVMTFGQRIAAGLSDTFYEIGEDLTDFSVDFITSLPYIVIWAVILIALFFLLRFVWKKIKKKKEQKLIDRYMKQIHEETHTKNP